MATYKFKDLVKKYQDFKLSFAEVTFAGTSIRKLPVPVVLSDVDIELSAGYEASIATFSLYNVFSNKKNRYMYSELKKYIAIGTPIVIAFGYGTTAKEVFRGAVTKVNFAFHEPLPAYIEITAMDVKGIMMAGSYSTQLKAKCYSEAVKEILNKTAYSKLTSQEMIKKITITDTPDKKGSEKNDKATDKSIEMVAESDYEFVVKAAKRFNYEFFTDCGEVLFRKAKADKSTLIELTPGGFLRDFDLEYDISGLVETIETRAMDPGKGEVISAEKKLSNKISGGSKAKTLIAVSRKVYVDPTICSKADADNRLTYLEEEVAYRYGSMSCKTIGLPEITPGHFIEIKGLGEPADNKFYATSVRHVMNGDAGFFTYVKGKAMGLQ